MTSRLARFACLTLVVPLLAACAGSAPHWTYAPDGVALHQQAGAPAAAPGSPAPVEAPQATADPTPGMDMPGMEMSPSPVPSGAAADPSAAPALYPAEAPAALPGTVHDINLDIQDVQFVVAPGKVVSAWTFGGTVPGPTIRVHLGDTLRVHLTNHGSMTHSIDFHASQTAMDHQMVEIPVGGTFTYTFTADYAGVWMYHCGTQPALQHIANGMFGMLIVEPRGGLTRVDHEYALVQSEWYLGQNGQPIDYTKASAANPAPDYVVFNGVPNQYKDHPIPVASGDRLRFFVLDAGPNEDSSFHIVGTIFDTVIKEGIALVKGNAGGWGSQAVDLAPAQGAIVELTIPEPGMYVFVTHAFNFVGLGAAGVLQASK